ncbi:MAG TPA: hypothetical protein VEZ71_17090, partial [Archangium sp.]|nr:hypothetical protein [Archangium sp.]
DAFYAAGECTRAKSHPGAALLEEMRALRAEVERMRQDANAQDAAWQERMAGAIKSQHELRQRAAAAERELTAAREQLQQTHQQVAEVARMLDPEVTPDTWGLHSAAEKRMGELTLLRMEKAAALSMSGNGHCIAPPPSSGVVWELVGACKRLRNARAKANVDLAAAVAHANDMERGLTMARERIAVLEKEAAEARQAWEELHTQRAADVLSRDEENSRIREQVERLGALVQQAEAEKQGARDAALEEAGAKMTTHVMEACGCEDTRNCLRAARDDVRALKSSPARFVPEAEVESLRKRAVGLVDFVEDAAKDACEEGGRVLPGCGECGPCVARKALAAWSDAHEG